MEIQLGETILPALLISWIGISLLFPTDIRSNLKLKVKRIYCIKFRKALQCTGTINTNSCLRHSADLRIFTADTVKEIPFSS